MEHPAPSTPARRRRAIAVVLIGLVAALGLSACSDTVGYTEPTGDKIQGEKLFVSNCGSCHTLRDAGTTGMIGPDLDYAFVQSRIDGLGADTILQVVRAQIAYPVTTPSTGAPGMPANIVEGVVGWMAIVRTRPPIFPGPIHVHAPGEMPAAEGTSLPAACAAAACAARI